MSIGFTRSKRPTEKMPAFAARFQQKRSKFVPFRAGVLLALLLSVLVLGVGSVNSSSGAIPTFAIQSVAADQTVTIVTKNFPAGQTFTVTMGPMGTLGINGYVVGSTSSGAGGSFTATYNIPDQLKGSYQISIRLQSPQGYYSYNWFYNNTTGAVGSPSSTAGTVGYSGIPTFRIDKVAADQNVTITTNNFPANQSFTVTMGTMGTRGINGVVVGKIESGKGGALTQSFDIPDKFKGAYQISIRTQTAHSNPYYAYNWFYNNTTSAATSTTSTTSTTGTTTAVVYTGIPTIQICSVEQNKTVTFRGRNFPPNQTFTVRMGAMWTAGIGGTAVGTFDSGAGGALEKTFTIPAHLQGAYRIAIRTETAHAYPYYAYNWFYNSTASVCN